MGQEAAAEQRVVLGLDSAALARAFHPLGAAAAGAVQAQPMAAGFEPAPERPALPGIGIRASDIGDQQPARRQPFFEIGKVVGDRGRNVAFGQQPQQPQAGIVVVVAGERPRRKAAGSRQMPAPRRRGSQLSRSCGSRPRCCAVWVASPVENSAGYAKLAGPATKPPADALRARRTRPGWSTRI